MRFECATDPKDSPTSMGVRPKINIQLIELNILLSTVIRPSLFYIYYYMIIVETFNVEIINSYKNVYKK